MELNICSRISALERVKYADLVNKAKIVEKDVQEFSGRREQWKNGGFDTGAGSSVRPRSLPMPTVGQWRPSIRPESTQSSGSKGGKRISGKGRSMETTFLPTL